MAIDLLSLPLHTNPDNSQDNTVWDVLARRNPGEPLVKVAKIEATASFSPSQWADEYMFFQHEPWQDTFALITDQNIQR